MVVAIPVTKGENIRLMSPLSGAKGLRPLPRFFACGLKNDPFHTKRTYPATFQQGRFKVDVWGPKPLILSRSKYEPAVRSPRLAAVRLLVGARCLDFATYPAPFQHRSPIYMRVGCLGAGRAQLPYTQAKNALPDFLLKLRNCFACFFYHVHEDLFRWTAFLQHAPDLS